MAENKVHLKIKELLDKNPVLLFMKGTTEAPQCGFSARVVDILKFLRVPFTSFNVLDDQEVREGVKEYASWPTLPQLYVKGRFVGGCDIIQQQFETGELEKAFSLLKSDTAPGENQEPH